MKEIYGKFWDFIRNSSNIYYCISNYNKRCSCISTIGNTLGEFIIHDYNIFDAGISVEDFVNLFKEAWITKSGCLHFLLEQLLN